MPHQMLRCAFGADTWGFFTREGGEGHQKVPPGMQLIQVADLPVPHVQFCRVAVIGIHGTTDVVVLMADFPALSRQTCEDIATAVCGVVPSAIVAFIIEDTPPRALVIGPASEECAFAVAVAKYRGSFSEIDPLEIVVEGGSFKVILELGDREHIGRVARDTQ